MSNLIQEIKEFIKVSATTHGPSTDPPLPPIAMSDVSSAEAELGVRFPSTLNLLYTEIGNGGFGPGFGFLPLVPTAEVSEGRFVVECCMEMRTTKNWDTVVLPVVSWGCGILSCLDLATEENPPVYRFEPNMPDAMTGDYLDGWPFKGVGLIPEKLTFEEWLVEWLAGKAEKLFQRMNEI